MKKEKIFIFDLDHTLINARKLREDLGLLINNNKEISSEDIWKFFLKNKEEIIIFLNQNKAKYLFLDISKEIAKINEKKILLTYGNIDFQKAKVDSFGIGICFDELILTEKSKIEMVKKIFLKNREKEVYFINDNYNKRFTENKSISEEIPEIKILEVDNYSKDKKNTIKNIFKIIFN